MGLKLHWLNVDEWELIRKVRKEKKAFDNLSKRYLKYMLLAPKSMDARRSYINVFWEKEGE